MDASGAAPPLPPATLERFAADGFVVLRSAFPAAVARACRDRVLWPAIEAARAVRRDDPATWPSHLGLSETFFPRFAPLSAAAAAAPPPLSAFALRPAEIDSASVDEAALWDQVVTRRLCAAISQLLGGPHAWDPAALGLGWWAVSFPEPEENRDDPWGAHGAWHIDGAHFKHFTHSREQALLPIFLFNDIEPRAGGTAVAVGSHHAVAQTLAYCQGDEGLTGPELTRRALEVPNILDSVVEITGRAGDVALLHPLLLHARGRNLGRHGLRSVRFICNPCIPALEDLRTYPGEAPLHSLSPVERPILAAMERVQAGEGSGLRKHKSAGRLERQRARNQRRKARKLREQQLAPDDEAAQDLRDNDSYADDGTEAIVGHLDELDASMVGGSNLGDVRATPLGADFDNGLCSYRGLLAPPSPSIPQPWFADPSALSYPAQSSVPRQHSLLLGQDYSEYGPIAAAQAMGTFPTLGQLPQVFESQQRRQSLVLERATQPRTFELDMLSSQPQPPPPPPLPPLPKGSGPSPVPAPSVQGNAASTAAGPKTPDKPDPKGGPALQSQIAPLPTLDEERIAPGQETTTLPDGLPKPPSSKRQKTGGKISTATSSTAGEPLVAAPTS